MNGYLDALAKANPKAGNESTPPHIVFGNCGGEGLNDNETLKAWDSSLREYVRTHGPVLAEPESVRVSPTVGGVRIQAQQRWDVLKREQRTLSAVMRVFEQTRSKKPSHVELFRAGRAAVSGTRHWIGACKREFDTRRHQAYQERPCWIWTENDQFRARALATAISPVDTRLCFTCPDCGEVHQIETAPVSQLLTCTCGYQSDLLRAISEGKLGENACPDWALAKGRALLCHILNAFSAKLTDYNGTPFEMPSEEVSAGILPVLYQLIRWDYLGDARIARCAWKDCTKWFRVGAHESPCCSPEHSLKYRQAEYYRQKGKAVRHLRRKREKKARARRCV
jgi:hypothetical protein